MAITFQTIIQNFMRIQNSFLSIWACLFEIEILLVLAVLVGIRVGLLSLGQMVGDNSSRNSHARDGVQGKEALIMS